jgi:hypothetical protein
MSDIHPAGKFLARPQSGAQLGETKNGTPEVAVVFETAHGVLTGHLYLSEGAAERSLKSLRYCGWTSDDIGDLSSIGPHAQVELVVEHETWEGKEYAKVEWVNKVGANLAPLDAGKKAALSARLRGIAMQTRAAVGVVTPPPATRGGNGSAAVDGTADRFREADQAGFAGNDIPF